MFVNSLLKSKSQVCDDLHSTLVSTPSTHRLQNCCPKLCSKMILKRVGMHHCYYIIVMLLLVTECGRWACSAQNISTAANKTCGKIVLSSGSTLELFENAPISQDDFQKVLDEKLFGAQLLPGPSREQRCILEICGFSRLTMNFKKFQYGGCQWFFNGTTAPGPIEYDRSLDHVRYLSCACQKEGCLARSCDDFLEQHVWEGSQCAILYREPNCGDCWYDALVLNHGELLQGRNSFSVKSTLIRPDCELEETTHGYFMRDWTTHSRYFDQEPVRKYVSDSFHKNSTNFTCYCNSSVVEDDTSTSIPSSPPTQIVLLTESHEQTSTTHLPTFVPSNTSRFRNITSKITSDSGGNLVFTVAAWVFSLTFAVIGVGVLVKFYRSRKFQAVTLSSHRTQSLIATVSKKPTAIGAASPEGASNQCNDPLQEDLPIFTVPASNGMSIQSFSKGDMYEQLENYIKYLQELAKVAAVQLAIETSSSVASSLQNYIGDEFYVKRHQFKVGRQIGSGQFGVVSEGLLNSLDGHTMKIAIKTLRPDHQRSDVIVESFMREARILSLIGVHENIVRFIGTCCENTRKEIFILTDFCENGSLQSYLRTQFNPNFDSKNDYGYIDPSYEVADSDAELAPEDNLQLLLWAKQIASGMEYLHSKKIVHVDLAARNILLDAHLEAKIADFGLSKMCMKSSEYVQYVISNKFPKNSLAPECLKRVRGEKAHVSIYTDVWAYGCTLWELFSLGRLPYSDMNIVTISSMFNRGERLEKPLFASDDIYSLMLDCWTEVPQDRCSFVDLQSFFTAKIS